MRNFLAALILFSAVPAAVFASAPVETVLLSENQVLSVKAEFNRPVTVKFPYPVKYVVPTDSSTDVKAGNDFVIFKVVDSSVKHTVLSVVLDRSGKPFVVPVEIDVVKERAPLKVVVRDRGALLERVRKVAEEKVKLVERKAASTPVTDLTAAMIRNTEFPKLSVSVPGYTVVDYTRSGGVLLKDFSRNNLLEARLLYEYRSPVRTGVVIELINRSEYPLQISEEDFAGDGVLAVSLSRRRLAPRPYTATEKLSGDYRAYLYLVIRGNRWQR